MKGNYLYGVVPSGIREDLGPIGIQGAVVQTVPFEKLAAVVHHCDIDTRIPNDEAGAAQWIVCHQDVVEKVWERFAVIAPSSFGTVIKGENPDQTTIKWLSDNYETLLTELRNLVGKAEYGVQIFWDIKKIGSDVVAADPELAGLRDHIQLESKGLAYLNQKKMERILRSRLEEKSAGFFKSVHERLAGMVNCVVIEKIKPAGDKSEPAGLQMVMNVSCLLPRRDEAKLGTYLDEINTVDGTTVRFTGPWPPYSFVGRYRSS
jgi:hypothetical protein